jgi:hypothetical protein
MIKAKVNGVEYQIPTKWQEVTFKQFMLLEETNEPDEIISIASGIPLDIIKQADEAALSKIAIVLGFLRVKLNPNGYSPPKELQLKEFTVPVVQDIREKSFGQKLHFNEVMKAAGQELLHALPEIVAIYAQPFFDGPDFELDKCEALIPLLEDVFFVDLYSAAFAYIEQLTQILEDEEKTLSSEPDQEQVEAGVRMFEQFGVMNTIKALANNDVTKYDDVLKIEYNTIFVTMRMNKTQKDFNENYRKIKERNRKNNAKK